MMDGLLDDTVIINEDTSEARYHSLDMHVTTETYLAQLKVLNKCIVFNHKITA